MAFIILVCCSLVNCDNDLVWKMISEHVRSMLAQKADPAFLVSVCRWMKLILGGDKGGMPNADTLGASSRATDKGAARSPGSEEKFQKRRSNARKLIKVHDLFSSLLDICIYSQSGKHLRERQSIGVQRYLMTALRS